MFTRDLLDLLLPQRCAGCRTARGLLCPSCAAPLALPARPVPAASLTSLNPPIWSIASYEGPVRALIAAHKEVGRTGLARPLGRALAVAIKSVLSLNTALQPPDDAPWYAERLPAPLAVWTPDPPATPPPREAAADLDTDVRPHHGSTFESAGRPPADHLPADGLPDDRRLAKRVPADVDGSAVGRSEGAVLWWQSDDPVIVVPVPSAARSVRKRGHDPTRRMTAVAVRELRAEGFPVFGAPLLRHRRPVADQAGLGRTERQANVTGAMGLSRREIRLLQTKYGDRLSAKASTAPVVKAVRRHERPKASPSDAGLGSAEQSSPRLHGHRGQHGSTPASDLELSAQQKVKTKPGLGAGEKAATQTSPCPAEGRVSDGKGLFPMRFAREAREDGDVWVADRMRPGSKKQQSAEHHEPESLASRAHEASPRAHEASRSRGHEARAICRHETTEPVAPGAADICAQVKPEGDISRSKAGDGWWLAEAATDGGPGSEGVVRRAECLDRVGPLVGWRVVVVDDVVTSGATLAEAVRVLRQAGAEVVGAATVAATPRRFLERG